MSNGISLHIGLNKVNAAHYNQLKNLVAAVNDAKFMHHYASNVMKYGQSDLLLDEDATTDRALAHLSDYARQLRAGDVLFLSYSGHGGQTQDLNSLQPGDELFDQTWCLYDRQLIDDELALAFSQFEEGVRILVVADSCHSGTVTKELPEGDDTLAALNSAFEQQFYEIIAKNNMRTKSLNKQELSEIFVKNKDQYREIYARTRAKGQRPASRVRAAVKLLAACQDSQVALDGLQHGLFTAHLRSLLEEGNGHGMNIGELARNLRAAVPYQTPNLYEYGGVIPAFEQYSPFRVHIPNAEIFVPGSNNTGISARMDEMPTSGNAAPDTAQGGVVATQHTPAEVSVRRIALHSTQGRSVNLQQLALICPSDGLIGLHLLSEGAIAEYDATQYKSAWEVIHAIAEKIDQNGLPIEAEPLEAYNFPVEDELPPAKEAGKEVGYLPYWPPGSVTKAEPAAGWHLDEEHSQMATARDLLWEEIKAKRLDNKVLIGHLDTGYFPEHPAFYDNPNIRRDLARSFVRGELRTNLDAEDYPTENNGLQGHGSGTMGIIAGWQLSEGPYANIGYVGAVPFAGIVPIRIADNVIIWNTDAFCDGLEYAMSIGCEVISMSMGGKPSRRMAKVINAAYEKGITIVTAAGNNFIKGFNVIGPKTIVFPARFPRVIAACGASYNHLPYDFEAQEKYAAFAGVKALDVRYMQGNWGPESCMQHALAAYSPNISWIASLDRETNDQKPVDHIVKKSGGGTSAATPQVASAAALWITKHHAALKEKGYHGTWRQVEAVREALYTAAHKGNFPEWKKYYGNGIIRVMDALKIGVPANIPESRKAPECESSWGGLGEALDLFLNRRRSTTPRPGPARMDAIRMECLEIILASESGLDFVNELDLSQTFSEDMQQKVADLILKSDKASQALKEQLQNKD